MAKNPADRYQDIEELARDLAKAAQVEAGAAAERSLPGHFDQSQSAMATARLERVSASNRPPAEPLDSDGAEDSGMTVIEERGRF